MYGRVVESYSFGKLDHLKFYGRIKEGECKGDFFVVVEDPVPGIVPSKKTITSVTDARKLLKRYIVNAHGTDEMLLLETTD